MPTNRNNHLHTDPETVRTAHTIFVQLKEKHEVLERFFVCLCSFYFRILIFLLDYVIGFLAMYVLCIYIYIYMCVSVSVCFMCFVCVLCTV